MAKTTYNTELLGFQHLKQSNKVSEEIKWNLRAEGEINVGRGPIHALCFFDI